MSHLTLYVGPMFSDKSSRLLDSLDRAEYSNLKTLAIKPKYDNRSAHRIISRKKTDGEFKIIREHFAYEIKTYAEINTLLRTYDILNSVAFDEVQFFGSWFPEFIQELLFDTNRNLSIYMAGLDMNYLRQPFGPMPALMAIADKVIKCTAVCFECARAGRGEVRATLTQALKALTTTTQVGCAETYEARCRACHTIPE